MSGTAVSELFLALPGGATAVYNSGGLAYYRHADWLGSGRLVYNLQGGVVYKGSYAPYGESYAETGSTGQRNFTGQNQDLVGDLYDFPAREYHPIQGRWIQPDPAGLGAVDYTNPQSWNRYGYVLGNPLRFTDPMGMANDCGGPCTPFTFNDPTTGCVVTVTYESQYSTGGIYDIPKFTSNCQGPQNSGSQYGPPGVPNHPNGGGGNQFQVIAKKQQLCVDSFYASNVGKAVEFGSVLSMAPGWGPNPGKSTVENVVLTGGKLVALNGLKKAAGNAVITSVVTGAETSIASTLEKFVSSLAAKALGIAETGGPLAVSAATVGDVMAHQTCTYAAHTPDVPSPF